MPISKNTSDAPFTHCRLLAWDIILFPQATGYSSWLVKQVSERNTNKSQFESHFGGTLAPFKWISTTWSNQSYFLLCCHIPSLRQRESESGRKKISQVSVTYKGISWTSQCSLDQGAATVLENHIYMWHIAYGSVSAGREKCLFYVLLFLKQRRRLVWPNQAILMTSFDLRWLIMTWCL